MFNQINTGVMIRYIYAVSVVIVEIFKNTTHQNQYYIPINF